MTDHKQTLNTRLYRFEKCDYSLCEKSIVNRVSLLAFRNSLNISLNSCTVIPITNTNRINSVMLTSYIILSCRRAMALKAL